MINPQWVNIDDEGAIHVLLGRLASALPPESIDAMWILPTRRAAGIESTVVILSVFDPAEPLRRRVGAVRWLVTRDRKGAANVEEQMHEYALAPAGALQRIVEGVMRRLGDNAVEPPQPSIIEGNLTRWSELLRSFGAPPDPTDNVAEHTDTDAAPAHAERNDDPVSVPAAHALVSSSDLAAGANS
jgi:hypothetical protein